MRFVALNPGGTMHARLVTDRLYGAVAGLVVGLLLMAPAALAAGVVGTGTAASRTDAALNPALISGDPTLTANPICTGDCNGDGAVTVDEILTMVNIALGNADVGDCLAADVNGNGQITIDEILTAVNNALNGCPPIPPFSWQDGNTISTVLSEANGGTVKLQWIPAANSDSVNLVVTFPGLPPVTALTYQGTLPSLQTATRVGIVIVGLNATPSKLSSSADLSSLPGAVSPDACPNNTAGCDGSVWFFGELHQYDCDTFGACCDCHDACINKYCKGPNDFCDVELCVKSLAKNAGCKGACNDLIVPSLVLACQQECDSRFPTCSPQCMQCHTGVIGCFSGQGPAGPAQCCCGNQGYNDCGARQRCLLPTPLQCAHTQCDVPNTVITDICVCCAAKGQSCVSGECIDPTPTPPPTLPTPTPTDTPTGPTPTPTRLPLVDNGDGTISDPNTGLMWEKKDQAGGLHDMSNLYAWAGRCSDTGTCQPDAASASTCSAAAGGAVGCAQCGGTATCEFTGRGHQQRSTIWQWLNQLNASNFAGHSDWRIPTSGGDPAGSSGELAELESILDPNCTIGPCELAAFNNNCTPGCTVANCSCTLAYYYWSASTHAPYPYNGIVAWTVGFSSGSVLDPYQTAGACVRAVRVGL
jgi:hypothetical protein